MCLVRPFLVLFGHGGLDGEEFAGVEKGAMTIDTQLLDQHVMVLHSVLVLLLDLCMHSPEPLHELRRLLHACRRPLHTLARVTVSGRPLGAESLCICFLSLLHCVEVRGTLGKVLLANDLFILEHNQPLNFAVQTFDFLLGISVRGGNRVLGPLDLLADHVVQRRVLFFHVVQKPDVGDFVLQRGLNGDIGLLGLAQARVARGGVRTALQEKVRACRAPTLNDAAQCLELSGKLPALVLSMVHLGRCHLHLEQQDVFMQAHVPTTLLNCRCDLVHRHFIGVLGGGHVVDPMVVRLQTHQLLDRFLQLSKVLRNPRSKVGIECVETAVCDIFNQLLGIAANS
mmetsp:Transcript_13320/g.21132  ORF Transcript_13320/g.21132 Transcript_13320/m.21132 type:complete len:341 (+) Transcript_13320:855-1877(+)